mgnify:CR=1 FL=1
MAEMARFARPLALLFPLLWAVACAEQAPEVVRTPTPPLPTTTAPRATATPLPGSGAAAPVVADESAPSPSPTPAYDPDSPRAVAPYRGIWLAQQELEQLPMSGAAWENLLAAADQPLPGPDIADQDDMSDVYLLARALVYARTGNPRYREAVLDGIEAVMGAEGNPRKTGILAVARNLPGYVIAADLANLSAESGLGPAFRRWLETMRTTTFHGSGGSYTLSGCHETRPNNFGTHCGAARIAIDLYLGDEEDLERAATVFEGWLGNRDAYAGFIYGRATWQANPGTPVGINPPGAEIAGYDVGGALPEEMRRAGDFRWPPKRTQYAWEALQGAVVQAELLSRAGYPAWQWEEQALLRAVQFLHAIEWEAQGDDQWQPWLINAAYGADFPAHSPARPGKNMGWTDWTHGQTSREQAGNGANADG